MRLLHRIMASARSLSSLSRDDLIKSTVKPLGTCLRANQIVTKSGKGLDGASQARSAPNARK